MIWVQCPNSNFRSLAQQGQCHIRITCRNCHKENCKLQANQSLNECDPPTSPTKNNPHSDVGKCHARFEAQKLHLKQILNQTRHSFEEEIIIALAKSTCRLSLVESLHGTGFHKSMEGWSITAGTIESVESMRNQIVGATLSSTKQAVKLHNLHQLHSLSSFKYDLVPLDHHHRYDIFLYYYDCVSALLHINFIKPTFIIKTSIK